MKSELLVGFVGLGRIVSDAMDVWWMSENCNRTQEGVGLLFYTVCSTTTYPVSSRAGSPLSFLDAERLASRGRNVAGRQHVSVPLHAHAVVITS